MIRPGIPSITVPMTSKMTLVSSKKVTGSCATVYIQAATAWGTLP